MSEPPLDPDPLEEVPRTLSALNAKVDQVVVNGEEAIVAVRTLIGKKDRNRRLTLLVAALALATTSLVGFQVHQRCVDNNAQDAKQVRLWEFVIGLSANTPSTLTPEQRDTQLKALREFLGDTYAPATCWWW